MKLLNTSTYEVHDFLEGRIPKYAILSHRWEDDEISYQDYRKSRFAGSKGHRKIVSACDFARRVRRQEWLWIDTVCIDKKSSAELSESINSMFNYYKEAWECYVYLSDVRPLRQFSPQTVLFDFERSRWFDRGWTLQELIAPLWIHFCTADWEVFFTKNCYANHLPAECLLRWSSDGCALLSRITTIPIDVLRNPILCSDYSVAQRMSWASRRQTTRVEDEAYCLLGLLDVNMPLLYGERSKAFMRLQQEILRNSSDESILACHHGSGSGSALLSSSPFGFANAGSIVQSYAAHIPRVTVESGLVKLRIQVASECYKFDEDYYLVRLRCTSNDADPSEASVYRTACFIRLKLEECGHYVRMSDRGWSDIESCIVSSDMLDDMTFYIHAFGDCATAKLQLRRQYEKPSEGFDSAFRAADHSSGSLSRSLCKDDDNGNALTSCAEDMKVSIPMMHISADHAHDVLSGDAFHRYAAVNHARSRPTALPFMTIEEASDAWQPTLKGTGPR